MARAADLHPLRRRPRRGRSARAVASWTSPAARASSPAARRRGARQSSASTSTSRCSRSPATSRPRSGGSRPMWATCRCPTAPPTACAPAGLQFFGDREQALREMLRVLVARSASRPACGARSTTAGLRAVAGVPERHAGPEAAAIMRRPFAGPDRAGLRALAAEAGPARRERPDAHRGGALPVAEQLLLPTRSPPDHWQSRGPRCPRMPARRFRADLAEAVRRARRRRRRRRVPDGDARRHGGAMNARTGMGTDLMPVHTPVARRQRPFAAGAGGGSLSPSQTIDGFPGCGAGACRRPSGHRAPWDRPRGRRSSA